MLLAFSQLNKSRDVKVKAKLFEKHRRGVNPNLIFKYVLSISVLLRSAQKQLLQDVLQNVKWKLSSQVALVDARRGEPYVSWHSQTWQCVCHFLWTPLSVERIIVSRQLNLFWASKIVRREEERMKQSPLNVCIDVSVFILSVLIFSYL